MAGFKIKNSNYNFSNSINIHVLYIFVPTHPRFTYSQRVRTEKTL